MEIAMIDFTSGGIFAATFGDDSRIVWNRIMRLEDDSFCSYSSDRNRQNRWRDRYISMLKEFTGFESVALFSTGSEATEAIWRVCRAYTNRPGVWGGLVDPDEIGVDRPKCDQFHGWTLGAMIMAGRVTWPELGIFPEIGASRFGQRPESTACMIMEPYHAPSGQFHKMDPTINRIMANQKEFGPESNTPIPLCIDEIQGGFGRTGKLWAHEHYPGLKPDFITIGKMAGGGLPLSALLGPAEIMESDAVKEYGHLHSTHSGNPLMCAVGCAVIEEIQRGNWIEESARKGEVLHVELSSFPVRTHGKGLMAGLEFQGKEEAARVVDLCFTRQLYVVDTGRKWVKLGPQLNITDEDLMMGIKILREVVEEVVFERKDYVEACGEVGEGLGIGSVQVGSDGVQADGGSGKPAGDKAPG
jgi:4-aminobutyrate aminotransferase-like enzyme